MEIKNKNTFEDIMRMREIAEIYRLTNQNEKYEMYHKNIIKLCDTFPKSERILKYKIDSFNSLNKTYKSLETTRELLKINPYSMNALINIAKHINRTHNLNPVPIN